MLSYGDSGRAPFVAEPVFIEVPPTAAAVKAGLRPGAQARALPPRKRLCFSTRDPAAVISGGLRFLIRAKGAVRMGQVDGAGRCGDRRCKGTEGKRLMLQTCGFVFLN